MRSFKEDCSRHDWLTRRGWTLLPGGLPGSPDAHYVHEVTGKVLRSVAAVVTQVVSVNLVAEVMDS